MNIGQLYLTTPNEPFPNEIKEISLEEFNMFKNDSETIRRFEYYKHRLTEIDLNLKSFHQAKALNTALLEKHQTEPIEYDFKGEALIEFNRCFINFITSFKSLIEHCEKKIAHIYTKDSEEFIGFKKFINDLHFDSFAYKLADQLRYYAIHATYPIDKVNFDVISFDLAKTDNMFEIGIFISRELIENSKTLKSKFSKHLSEIGEGVEIVPVLKDARVIIEKILKKFIITCESEFVVSANRLIKLTEGKHEELGLTYLEQKEMNIIHHSIMIPIEPSKFLIDLIK